MQMDRTKRTGFLLPVGLSEQYTLPGKIQSAGRSLPFEWGGCDNTIFFMVPGIFGRKGAVPCIQINDKKINFFKDIFSKLRHGCIEILVGRFHPITGHEGP